MTVEIIEKKDEFEKLLKENSRTHLYQMMDQNPEKFASFIKNAKVTEHIQNRCKNLLTKSFRQLKMKLSRQELKIETMDNAGDANQMTNNAKIKIFIKKVCIGHKKKL